MVNFSHYGVNKVDQDKTVEYTFHNLMTIEGICPKILVRHAGKSNKMFFKEALNSSRTGDNKVKKDKKGNIIPAKVTIEMIDSADNNTYEVYAKCIVAGFIDNTIFDENGKPVEYSYQNTLDFLKAIPVGEFDDFSNFCSDIDNFQEHKKIDIKAKVKN